MTYKTIGSSFLLALFVSTACLHAQNASHPALEAQINKQLQAGEIDQAIGDLERTVKADPRNDQAHLALGFVRVIGAIETLGQTMNRFGLVDNTMLLNFIRLPVAAPDGLSVKETQKVTYEDVRAMMKKFNDDLAKAQQALAAMSPNEVKLPIHFGMIRMDLNDDGQAGANETLWKIFAQMNRGMDITEESAGAFKIAFDRGDAYWLEGYCHLLMGLADLFLAYDHKEFFEHTAHIFFKRADSPYTFLQESRGPYTLTGRADFTDIIAAIHLLRFELREPERMKSALAHYQNVFQLSEKMWASILAEKDDDHEWIPHPSQTGVLAVGITREQIDAWLAFVTEAQALLKGEKLAPFWRTEQPDVGININRIFTEPTRFDLILWVQGPGLAKYIEKGKLTNPDIWRQLQGVFSGDLVNFAMWWN